MSNTPTNNRLGKGLDELIPTDISQLDELVADSLPQEVRASEKNTSEISVDAIDTNPYQPRSEFEETELQQLSESIKQHGVLQPLILTKESDMSYKLVAGERRLRAAKLAGLKTVPAIVRSFSEQQKLEVALIENVQRENLRPLEQAAAYARLEDQFNMSQAEISKAVGKAQSTVANIMRLLKLTQKGKTALNDGVITEGHARCLLALVDPVRQDQFLNYIIKHNLTVRHAENLVREFKGGVEIKKRKVAAAEAPQRKIITDLGKFLGTKVSLQKSAKGGKVQIEYYSDEELARIYKSITGQDPQV